MKSQFNSVAVWSISLKFDAVFDYLTSDTLQTFKVKEPKVKVTVCRNVCISIKNVIKQERIG